MAANSVIRSRWALIRVKQVWNPMAAAGNHKPQYVNEATIALKGAAAPFFVPF
jgi:hypothetical protein